MYLCNILKFKFNRADYKSNIHQRQGRRKNKTTQTHTHTEADILRELKKCNFGNEHSPNKQQLKPKSILLLIHAGGHRGGVNSHTQNRSLPRPKDRQLLTLFHFTLRRREATKQIRNIPRPLQCNIQRGILQPLPRAPPHAHIHYFLWWAQRLLSTFESCTIKSNKLILDLPTPWIVPPTTWLSHNCCLSH